MFQLVNGQWFNDGQPSAAPPQGSPYWTGEGQNREFRTFYGPESLPNPYAAVNAPQRPPGSPAPDWDGITRGIQDGTIKPRPVPMPTPNAGWVPNPAGAYGPPPGGQQRPLTPQVTVPNLAGNISTAANSTPPIPPGMPPAANPFAVNNGRIAGSTWSNPESTAPKGYNPELWAQRNMGVDRTGYAPMVTNVPGTNSPQADPAGLFRMPGDGFSVGDGNEYSQQLIDSLKEAAQYGVYNTGIGQDRAQLILNAIQNPALIRNPARQPVGPGGKMGGPTNPVDRAGLQFDAMKAIAEQRAARRLPPPPETIMEDTDHDLWVPGIPGHDYNANPNPLLGPASITTTTPVQGNPFSALSPTVPAGFQTQQPAMPLSPEQAAQRAGLAASPSPYANRATFTPDRTAYDAKMARKAAGRAEGIARRAARSAIPQLADGTVNPFMIQAVQNPFLAPAASLSSYATGTLPVGPMPLEMERSIYDRFKNNSLTTADMVMARRYSNSILANAISKRLVGLPATYTTWSAGVTSPTAPPPPQAPQAPPQAPPPPPTPTTPTPNPTPTGPAIPTTPQMNPQVIWYGGDVWKNAPTLQYINDEVQRNPFMNLSRLSSYDPATDTKLNSPRSLNAKTAMDIENDPVALGFANSVYARHNRSREKEFADAVRNAPMGSASQYVRTG